MTGHQHLSLRSVVRRTAVPVSLAVAAAAYDPGLLVQLRATQHWRLAGSPTLLRRHGPHVRRRRSSVAIATPCRV
jgi:hypothetical protein